MSELRLVIFDVDGTLVDSEADIFAAMTCAYESIGEQPPTRKNVRSVVGLSLENAFLQLSPQLAERVDDLLAAYRHTYFDLRKKKSAAVSSPLFPGAREVLERLNADPWTLLAVATGKSKRGLDKLLVGHGLEGMFASQQVSDFHPSKPHPSMIEACLRETGVEAQNTLMVGDTSFDMDMARAAGVTSVAVGWGYHPLDSLVADYKILEFGSLPGIVESVAETTS